MGLRIKRLWTTRRRHHQYHDPCAGHSGLSGVKDVAGGLGGASEGYHNLALSSAIPPPTTNPQRNTYDSDGFFSVSGSAQAGSTMELFEGTTSEGSTQADFSSGAWSIDLSDVSEGAHTYSAKAKDAEGNTSSAPVL